MHRLTTRKSHARFASSFHEPSCAIKSVIKKLELRFIFEQMYHTNFNYCKFTPSELFSQQLRIQVKCMLTSKLIILVTNSL